MLKKSQSSFVWNSNLTGCLFFLFAKSGHSRQAGSFSLRGCRIWAWLHSPSTPKPQFLSVALALFALSTWQVVTRESEGSKGTQWRWNVFLSLLSSQAGGDLDTFLGLASHYTPHVATLLWFCHCGQGCVRSHRPTERLSQVIWFPAPDFVTHCSTRFSLHCFWTSAELESLHGHPVLLCQVQQMKDVWSLLRTCVTNPPALLGNEGLPGTQDCAR